MSIQRDTTDVGLYSLAVDRKNKVFYGLTVNPEYTFVKFSY